jgi:hypothetical protein
MSVSTFGFQREGEFGFARGSSLVVLFEQAQGEQRVRACIVGVVAQRRVELTPGTREVAGVE